MTNDLHTLLRDHVASGEPASTLAVDDVFRSARRRTRSRRLTVAAGCLAVLATTAVAVPWIADQGGTRGSLDTATAEALAGYDARAFPATFRDTVEGSLDGVGPELESREIVAYDSQHQALPPKYFDKASLWGGTFSWSDTHWVDAFLMHSRSESEGSARRYCDDMLSSGYDLECTVDTGVDGEVLITTVSALRRGAPDMTGEPTWYAVDDIADVRPERLWFTRAVEARRGGIYVTTAREVVKAASREEAEAAFRTPYSVLRSIATDPVLAFPEPPKDANGCDWTLPGTGFSC